MSLGVKKRLSGSLIMAGRLCLISDRILMQPFCLKLMTSLNSKHLVIRPHLNYVMMASNFSFNSVLLNRSRHFSRTLGGFTADVQASLYFSELSSQSNNTPVILLSNPSRYITKTQSEA